MSDIFKYGSVEDLKIKISKSEYSDHYEKSWPFYFGFQYACEYGNVNIVEYFISMGPDKDCLESGLYEAFSKGHFNIVELLIKNGAGTKHSLKEYNKYKLAQVFKFTKLHESLVDFVLSK